MPSAAETKLVYVGGRYVTAAELLAWSQNLDKEKLTLNEFLDRRRPS